MSNSSTKGRRRKAEPSRSQVARRVRQRLRRLRAEAEQARSQLLAYAKAQWAGYQVAPHHTLIAEKLEAVERGDLKRLMIFMPPRHGKSQLGSEFFPAWALGRRSDRQIIAATYAQELADDFGRALITALFDAMHWSAPVLLGLDDNLWQLMLGMLGMGGLRTFEKLKGVTK